MIDRDPVVIVRRLLREQWQNDNLEVAFDVNRIHAGHPGEIRREPQISVIHVGDSTTGNTGYNYITPDGPATRVGVRLQIDCWVPNSSQWDARGGAGRARNHRWELQKEVDRIIHANSGGSEDENGNRELQYLGTISRRRSTQTDPSPEIFRASMDIRCIYFQLPPVEQEGEPEVDGEPSP